MSVPRARVLPQLCCSAGGGCPGTAQQLHTCIQVNHDQANEACCFVIAEPNTTKHITNVDITALNQETEQTANSLTPPRSTNNQMHRSQAAHHQISFSSTNSVELPAPLSSPPAAQRGRYLQRCFCALSFMCASGKLCGRRNPAVWLRRCRPPAFVPGRRSPPAAAPLAQGGAVPCLRRRIGRHRGLSLRPARQRGGAALGAGEEPGPCGEGYGGRGGDGGRVPSRAAASVTYVACAAVPSPSCGAACISWPGSRARAAAAPGGAAAGAAPPRSRRC